MATCPNRSDKSWMVILELCDRDLEDLLDKSAEEMPWSMRLAIGQMIASGMGFIHSRGVHHYDLKSGNVLLKQTDAGWTVKIADFGMITATQDSPDAAPEPGRAATKEDRSSERGSVPKEQGPVGTHEYMSPEASQGKPEAASDVFSFMVILWRLATRMRPYLSLIHI